MDFLSYPSNLFKVVIRKMLRLQYFCINLRLTSSSSGVLARIHMNGQSTRKLVKIALLKVR